MSEGANTPTAQENAVAKEGIPFVGQDNPHREDEGKIKVAKVEAVKPFYDRAGLYTPGKKVTVTKSRAAELIDTGYAKEAGEAYEIDNTVQAFEDARRGDDAPSVG